MTRAWTKEKSYFLFLFPIFVLCSLFIFHHRAQLTSSLYLFITPMVTLTLLILAVHCAQDACYIMIWNQLIDFALHGFLYLRGWSTRTGDHGSVFCRWLDSNFFYLSHAGVMLISSLFTFITKLKIHHLYSFIIIHWCSESVTLWFVLFHCCLSLCLSYKRCTYLYWMALPEKPEKALGWGSSVLLTVTWSEV